MLSSSPEGENVLVSPAFSTLKGWSRARHAIAQEGVLLIHLSTTSCSKPQSDTWLALNNRPELRNRNRSHDLASKLGDLASKSGDLWFEGSLSVAKHFLQARWSHCPYTAAAPEMGMRQKSHGTLSFPSVPKCHKLKNVWVHFSFLLGYIFHLVSKPVLFICHIHPLLKTIIFIKKGKNKTNLLWHRAWNWQGMNSWYYSKQNIWVIHSLSERAYVWMVRSKSGKSSRN